ncbi:Oxidoreductase [metagenome]|uniref:Oxidoreductase n=1 Tax=metagenome TaxID=256318 RepID=A0A2P2CAT4_9ZZZZ
MSPRQPEAPVLLRVMAARWQAEGVTSYELACPSGRPLPPWAPGAHIDVHLPSGKVRQYSLCGDPADTSRYRVAVLELLEGRGGSVEVHRELRPGVSVAVGLPREDFALVDAERYVFVAGGIGITPILAMVRECERRGKPWELVYGARTPQHFAFTGELVSLGADRIRFLAADVDGRPDLAAIVKDSEGAAVFCCGPSGLMDALSAEMADAGRSGDLHLERFAPATPGAGSDLDGGDGFEVELARSAVLLPVSADQSILDAIRGAGIEHPSSCEMGFCGTCETAVLEGVVDHRDDLLTAEERAVGDTMMVCVSRAKCRRLVLDL